MVIDVEAIGLHGEGFAVAWVVVESEPTIWQPATGAFLEAGLLCSPPEAAQGTAEDRAWVKANVPYMKPTHAVPNDMRNAFWQVWLGWKAKGCQMVADCNWPVEARFLEACVAEDPIERNWQGPYPLHDLATLLLARGKDPLGEYERHRSELPKHHPHADAMQSARLWLENFKP